MSLFICSAKLVFFASFSLQFINDRGFTAPMPILTSFLGLSKSFDTLSIVVRVSDHFIFGICGC